MSKQANTQKTPSRPIQFISEEQKQHDTGNLKQSHSNNIPTTMSFSRSFTTKEDSEKYRSTQLQDENAGYRSLTHMPDSIAAETTVIDHKLSWNWISPDPFSNTKQNQNQNQNQNQKKEKENEKVELEVKANVWEGNLTRYNTHKGSKSPLECKEAIIVVLKKLEEEKLIDWEIEEYSVNGRMYHQSDMSEFIIQVYQSSNNEYKSVIEIRRTGGDSFVHDELNSRVLQFLKQNQVIISADEPQEEGDFGLSLPSLTFDWKELGALSSESEEISDQETQSTNDNVLSIQQIADELIEVVTDRNSYQDIYRHSSGALYQELKTSSPLTHYVLSLDNIIQKLVTPLLDGFYDTLIIRNMLQAVKILLEQGKQKVSVYKGCGKDITQLRNMWNKSVKHSYIDLQFVKSQQVTRLCTECLELLR